MYSIQFFLVPSSEETYFLTTFYGLYFSHHYTHHYTLQIMLDLLCMSYNVQYVQLYLSESANSLTLISSKLQKNKLRIFQPSSPVKQKTKSKSSYQRLVKSFSCKQVIIATKISAIVIVVATFWKNLKNAFQVKVPYSRIFF